LKLLAKKEETLTTKLDMSCYQNAPNKNTKINY